MTSTTGETFCNYIDGDWVPGGSTVRNINPSDTSDVIGVYAQADAADARMAVAAAARAFQSWQFSGIQQRFAVVDRIGTELLARRDELGLLLSRH